MNTRRLALIVSSLCILMLVGGMLLERMVLSTGGTVNIEPNSFQSDVAFTVFANGGYAYCRNGGTGQIDLTSSNQSYAANYALSSLTSGRSSKEKVVLKGEFQLDSPLLIYSYTLLELNGKATLASGLNKRMIQVANVNTGVTDVDIIGGEWNGSKATHTGSGQDGFELVNSTRVTVKDTYIHDIARYGAVSFADSYGVLFTNNIIADCGGPGELCDGVFTHAGNSTITNNIFSDLTDTAIVIEYDNATVVASQKTGENCIVSGNQIIDCNCGIQGYWGPQEIIVSGNNIVDTVEYPIKLSQQYIPTRKLGNAIITGNNINGSLQKEGINLWNCSSFDISHNILSNTALDGIVVKESCGGSISNNHISKSGCAGIQVTGINGTSCHDITVDGNTIEGNLNYSALSVQSEFGTSSYCYNIVVLGNIISNVALTGVHAGSGIEFARTRNSTIADNRIMTTSDHGITLYETLNITVNDNSAFEAATYDMLLNGGCNGTVLSGNHFETVGMAHTVNVNRDNIFNGNSFATLTETGADSLSNVFIGNYPYVSPSDQIGTASVIISTDGTTVTAVNCTSGAVMAQDTNSSYVWNTVFTNCVSGDTIFANAGKYTLDSPLLIPYTKVLHISGAMIDDPQSSSNPTNGTIIRYDTDDYIIKTTGWTSGADEHGNLYIENLYLVNAYYLGVGSGIKIEGVNTGILRNIIVVNEKTPVVGGGSVGIMINNTSGETWQIDHVTVMRFEKGFDISAPHLTFTACHTYLCNYGFCHEDYKGMDTTYINCQAEGSVYRAWRVYHEHILLLNPQVEGITNETGIGIEVLGGYGERIIINPYFADLTSGAIRFSLASGVQVLGAEYQNSGSTASCVNGTWIATGLAGPVTTARFQINGTLLINATCYVMTPTIISQNSTHVQIEFLYNNAGTIAPVDVKETKVILWTFEYKP